MHVTKRKSMYILSLTVIAALAIVIRYYRLDADPDTSLSLSRVFYTDEGMNSCNAINNYLTGNWICDDHNHILLMPVMPYLQHAFFRGAGLSQITARIPSVTLSFVILILLSAFVCGRYKDNSRKGEYQRYHDGPMVVFLLLLATNYYLYIYSRLALLDVPMLAFGILSYFLFFKAHTSKVNRRGMSFYALSGLSLGISFLTKPSAALFPFAMLIFVFFTLLFARWRFKRLILGTVLLFAVTLTTVLLCRVLVASAFSDSLYLAPNHLISDRISLRPAVILRNYLKFFNNLLIRNNIFLVLLAGINCILLVYKAFKKKNVDDADYLMGALLIACYLFHGFFIHQVPRYFLVLLVPVIYFVGTLPITLAASSAPLRFVRHTKFILAIILLANSWNFYKIIAYNLHPQFSVRDVAHQVRDDIMADSRAENSAGIMLYGDFAATLSITNHLRFGYIVPAAGPLYVISQGEIVGSDKVVTLINSYDMLNNYWCYEYGSKRIYLYRQE